MHFMLEYKNITIILRFWFIILNKIIKRNNTTALKYYPTNAITLWLSHLWYNLYMYIQNKGNISCIKHREFVVDMEVKNIW